MRTVLGQAFILLMLSLPLAAAEATNSHLQIRVRIDGRDDLHLSRHRFWWVHKEWSTPNEVQINGVKWNLKESMELVAPVESPWLRNKLDLKGAVLHQIRGRGTVHFAADQDGLVVQFADTETGSDEYEVTIDFAQDLQKEGNANSDEGDFEWWLTGRIDGCEEIQFVKDYAHWIHKESARPLDIVVNGESWDAEKRPTIKLNTTLLPEVWDLQRATLKKHGGRGVASLDYLSGKLIVCLEDHAAGAGDYDVTLNVPRFGNRHLVTVKSGLSDGLLGVPLRIYREIEESEGYKARALLSGQRCFDAKGNCSAALPEGKYLFEVQQKLSGGRLVSLKSDLVKIAESQTVELQGKQVLPRLRGPNNKIFRIDELQIRSAWKTGAITWGAADEKSGSQGSVWISKNQSYQIHAFGHDLNHHVAVWKDVAAEDFDRISLDQDQYTTCAFHWDKETPAATRRGVKLEFPDGQMGFDVAENTRFSTNRRFFTRSYWLEFPGPLKAVFQPQGCLLPAHGGYEFLLGGALRPVSSAAILEDENLGKPNAKHLWWEITLADSQNDLLDVAASKINWSAKLQMSDGAAAKTAPLQAADIKALGNLKDTLTASASFRMQSNQTVTASPELWVKIQSEHFSTRLPAYHNWGSRSYLGKMEREIGLIAENLDVKLDPTRRMNISWWFNHGAVGANYSVTLPITGYVESREWFGHPWSIAHEMLHNFGYGHTHEMNRLDNRIQERVEQMRWFAADHPEFDPGPLAFEQKIFVENN